MPPVTIPSFTKAGLPASPAAGDLARVTDNLQGIWMGDTRVALPTQFWFSLVGEVVNVKDFGAVGDDAAPDAVPIQNAINAATGIVYFPPGRYRCEAPLNLKVGVVLAGASYLTTWLRFINATQGLVFVSANSPAVQEAGICVRDLRILGDSTKTLELISITQGTMVVLERLNVRQSKTDCILLDGCHSVTVLGCRIEDAVKYGVHVKNTGNVFTIQGGSFASNGVPGIASVAVENSGWGGIRDNDFEGSTFIQHAITLNAAIALEIHNNFMENYTASVIDLSTAASKQIAIVRNHINSSGPSNVILIDGGTLNHTMTQVESNRFVNGGRTCFQPGGPSATFVYRFADQDSAATHVVGYSGAAVERYNAAVRQLDARLLTPATISGSSPSVANLAFAQVSNISNTNLLNLLGAPGQLITLQFMTNNTTVMSTNNLKLAGGTNTLFTLLDTLTLLNVDGLVWVEVARSINA